MAAAAWGLFASALGAGLRQRGRARGQVPSCSRSLLRRLCCSRARSSGTAASAGLLAAAHSPSSPVRPRSPGSPGIHTAFLFALFQGDAGQTKPRSRLGLGQHFTSTSPWPTPLEAGSSTSPPLTSHTVGHCGPGEEPRCQRSPPLRVDGKPVLNCGLRGGWGYVVEFPVTCRMLILLNRTDQSVRKSGSL